MGYDGTGLENRWSSNCGVTRERAIQVQVASPSPSPGELAEMSDREPATHDRWEVGDVVAIEGVTWFPVPPQLMECEVGMWEME